MKKIKDLSFMELANMSDSDFGNIVNIDLAERGIPIVLPDPPQRKEVPQIKPVCQLYKLPEVEVYLDSMDKACQLREFIISLNPVGVSLSYIEGIGYRSFKNNVKYDYITADLRVLDIYDKNDLDEFIQIKNDYDEEGKSYEQRLECYKKIKTDRYEAISDLWELKRSAEGKVSRLNRLCDIFVNEYIQICGDLPEEEKEKMALAFFRKAYNTSEEEEEYIISSYKQLNN